MTHSTVSLLSSITALSSKSPDPARCNFSVSQRILKRVLPLPCPVFRLRLWHLESILLEYQRSPRAAWPRRRTGSWCGVMTGGMRIITGDTRDPSGFGAPGCVPTKSNNLLHMHAYRLQEILPSWAKLRAIDPSQPLHTQVHF